MTPAASGVLAERARKSRARWAVKAWEYRQLHHAKGVWFQLQMLLAQTESVWAIPAEAAAAWIAAGAEPHPAGSALEPPKTILVVSAEQLATVNARSPLPLRPGPALLAARYLAIVAF